MNKNINTSIIDSNLKYKAEHILDKVGLTPEEAMYLFYLQVCLHQGLPFGDKELIHSTKSAQQKTKTREMINLDNIEDLFHLPD